MLAQNFKTAVDLGISDIELDALIKVLGMLERGEINQQTLDMANFLDEEDCGTVACICGWAHLVSNQVAFPEVKDIGHASAKLMKRPYELRMLFLVYDGLGEMMANGPYKHQRTVSSVLPDEAARALRSYLTTGEANWAEALNG